MYYLNQFLFNKNILCWALNLTFENCVISHICHPVYDSENIIIQTPIHFIALNLTFSRREKEFKEGVWIITRKPLIEGGGGWHFGIRVLTGQKSSHTISQETGKARPFPVEVAPANKMQGYLMGALFFCICNKRYIIGNKTE